MAIKNTRTGGAQPDYVNHPPHYESGYGGIECIDAIHSALDYDGFRAFLKGQVIKYTWRMNHTGTALEDAEKAQWYQNKLVEVLRQDEVVVPVKTARALAKERKDAQQARDDRYHQRRARMAARSDPKPEEVRLKAGHPRAVARPRVAAAE